MRMRKNLQYRRRQTVCTFLTIFGGDIKKSDGKDIRILLCRAETDSVILLLSVREYISYLMTVEELMFIDEIVCMDLFPGEDPREKIAIFELDYME